MKEYELDQLTKRTNGDGGIWRIPPAFDGNVRSPLPRFTALNPRERATLRRYFAEWGALVARALRPGGHLFIASNSFLSQLAFCALVDSGLEFRGEIVRLVRTLRGGDRPKNAELEFPGVSSLPRGCYEPWGLLRKPMPPGGIVADPFMGSGSTIAAAEATGVRCIGVERHAEYYEMARTAIPKLQKVTVNRDPAEPNESAQQLRLLMELGTCVRRLMGPQGRVNHSEGISANSAPPQEEPPTLVGSSNEAA